MIVEAQGGSRIGLYPAAVLRATVPITIAIRRCVSQFGGNGLNLLASYKGGGVHEEVDGGQLYRDRAGCRFRV
jgi:hypothetical protein